MKKIIAMVLSMVMLLSMTAHAGNVSTIFPLIKSGAITSEITFECDVPGVVAGLGMISFIDPELLVSGLSGAKIKSEEKYDVNDDYTRIVFSVIFDMELPLNLNSNFQIGAHAKVGMWLEYDVTDEANPVCKVILATPADSKYIAIDVVEELAARGYDIDKLTSDFKKYINKENIEKYMQKLNDIMMSNATVTEGENSVSVSISGEQYLNCIKEMLDYFSGIMTEYDFFVQDFNINLNTDEVMPEGMDISMNIQINYDSKGEMVDSDVKCTVAFDEEMAKEAGMNSFSVAGNSVYSGINLPISIEFPELTEENSVNHYAIDTYYSDCEWFSAKFDYMPAEDETFYVPWSEIMPSLRECGHKFTVENHSGKVVITSTDEKDSFNKIEFSVGSCEFSVDSEKFVTSNPFIYKNGTVYADNYFWEKAFGYTWDTARSELLDGKTFVIFTRECPFDQNEDTVTEEEYYDYYDDYSYEDSPEEFEYCWHYENLWIPVDYPAFNNDYFGLRAVVDNHVYSNGYKGQIEMTYDNGVVTIVNNGENTYFKTATVTVGSNTVVVDGTEYQTALPAINEGGKVYIDKDAISSIFKYEIKRINIIYPADGSESFKSADFERIIPGCTHDYDEIKWYSSFTYGY